MSRLAALWDAYVKDMGKCRLASALRYKDCYGVGVSQTSGFMAGWSVPSHGTCRLGHPEIQDLWADASRHKTRSCASLDSWRSEDSHNIDTPSPCTLHNKPHICTCYSRAHFAIIMRITSQNFVFIEASSYLANQC